MDSQGLFYINTHSRLLLQDKENFDPVNKTFAGVHRNNDFGRRTNSKFVNYVFQRHTREPLKEIFIYQKEEPSIVIVTEAVTQAVETFIQETEQEITRSDAHQRSTQRSNTEESTDGTLPATSREQSSDPEVVSRNNPIRTKRTLRRKNSNTKIMRKTKNTVQNAKKKDGNENKKARTIKPVTKPKMESLLKLR